MSTSRNPFSFLRETKRFPLSRIQRTTLWQKTADAFMVTFGMYADWRTNPTQTLGTPAHWGIFDYLTFGIQKFLTQLFAWILPPLLRSLDKRGTASLIIGSTFAVIFLLPLIISFGCLWIARYVISALFSFLAMPFILLTHLATGSALRHLISEPNPNESHLNSQAEDEPNYFSDKIQQMLMTEYNIPPESQLPSSTFTQIRSELNAIRCFRSSLTTSSEMEKSSSDPFFTLLIDGQEITPEAAHTVNSESQLYFAMRHSFLDTDNVRGVVERKFARRGYDAAGVLLYKAPQTKIRSTDQALLSLLEAAIKLNIDHITTRFEKNGTLDLILSYLCKMQGADLIAPAVLPKEMVENVVMEYLDVCRPTNQTKTSVPTMRS